MYNFIDDQGNFKYDKIEWEICFLEEPCEWGMSGKMSTGR